MPLHTDAPPTSPAGRGLGLSLLVIATAQLMLVLDDTIANIALPSIRRELNVSSATLPWVVNAYVLAFGSLLLFGGRVGDLFGRRRVMRVGLVVFTVASLLGGLAPNAALVVAARGIQGIGAALVAPNVLASIDDPEVRGRVEEDFRRFENALTRTIERGQADGSVKSTRNARELARLLVLAFPGFQVMVRAGGDKAWLDDALRLLLSNLD
jgi:hypothetical protein